MLLIFCLVAALTGTAAVRAATYYVSPTGSDLADGTSVPNAWLTIDNGDRKGWISGGDTIRVLAGTYPYTTSMELATPGTAALPTVYISEVTLGAVVDFGGTNSIVRMTGAHMQFLGFEVSNTGEDTFYLLGDSCLVEFCYLHNAAKDGIRLEGSHNVIRHNTIADHSDNGINHRDTGTNNRIYGNTIYGCAKDGVELQGGVTGVRIFNNCIVDVDKGIDGSSSNGIVGFNCIWNNVGNDYDGIADSAGGIAADPLFTDAASHDFTLLAGSPCIDRGLDLGYPFVGDAPDMGADESSAHAPVVYWVSVTGDNANDGLDSTSAWRNIMHGDTLGVMGPGDTVNVMAGTYAITRPRWLTASGTNTAYITYRSFGDTRAIVDIGLADSSCIVVTGKHTVVEGFELRNSGHNGLIVAADSCIIGNNYCHNNGWDGIHIQGDDILILGNLTLDNNQSGIENTTGAQRNSIVNNTIFRNGTNGILCLAFGAQSRAYNNIIVANDTGIWGYSDFICAYNDVWGNVASSYENGAVDSAGGVSVDPLFVDTSAVDFTLQQGSPVIDAGLDKGYDFNGPAPDMGAYEAPSLATISITPVLDTLKADSSYQFTVTALDTAGMPADPGNLTWSHTFASGAIDDTGLFVPDLVGSGEVSVESDIWGITGVTATMVVAPGMLDSLIVAPDRDTISADSTRSFTLTGHDANGNVTTDYGTIDWTVEGGIGTIDAAGLFDATTVGAGFINAVSSLGVSDKSDSVFVVAGEPATLEVLPANVSLGRISFRQFAANGYDADGNAIGALTDSVTWSTTDPGGAITSGGLYRSGTVSGNYDVTAE
ncbi:MAG: right-handed parallel beta-helix repeat-containing protein, partial [candidate division Zixibacteria bacterium]|nr:right-handed parallel beta-helix repeat-containing protein [candidate division Zixibacteria bacterium]